VLDPGDNGVQLITLESSVSYLNADYEPAVSVIRLVGSRKPACIQSLTILFRIWIIYLETTLDKLRLFFTKIVSFKAFRDKYLGLSRE
jgi:hypothetical protein